MAGNCPRCAIGRRATLAQSLSWKSVLAGIRFVWTTKLILATITLDLFAVLLGGATYLVPIYRHEYTSRRAAGLRRPAGGRRHRGDLHGRRCWPIGRRCAGRA